ncbi:two pore potassium channel protein sup-9 [Acyrthosiphon pisum]|uniref:Potassium channel domain-containing protein n=1 Tax=Acyrthosiphon pisum TaxID=7029 RepID=A0A8R2F6R9_ACYPI|nr:two pore potassium channel protein sup-9 [Acyrthosiphon pisum]XP_008181114.1 two pore potassium channel protein sup-9 [Acyrthosiphon pisum]|eukprot:XP_001945406.1 PREDICTED: two pore potassium channel protein sup-9 [Acyrthosiphon pisum]
MKKQNVRTLSLIVCTFTYLLIGAAVFDALESETEIRRKQALDSIEGIILNKYNISTDDYRLIETIVLKSEPHKAGQQWKFAGAFYFATTVLTTIGYGHSTPNTKSGKLFTMFYAMVGIPLGLVMFQSIGEQLNKFSSVVIRQAKRALGCKRTEATEINLIFVVSFLSSLTIAGGATAFSSYEGWTYFDSVYYCFVTLTTIGFGDMVALQKNNTLNDKLEYVAFTLIFILFGLAVVAASLDLLVLRFVTMNTEDERRDEAEALQAAQGAVRLEGDVITSHGSVSSLPMGSAMTAGGSGRGRGSSSPADNASVCTCTCTRSRSRNDGYRSGDSPPYASGYGVGTGRGVGSGGDRDDGDDGCSGDDDDDEDDDGTCEPQDIQLDTFYDGRETASTSADPYRCRQRVVQTQRQQRQYQQQQQQQQQQQLQQLQNEHRSSI